MSNRDICAVISLISSKMKDSEEIIDKELMVMYDEILPDLYIDIELSEDIRNKYGISNKCKIDSVLYDVYADRIRKVKIYFPNSTVGYYDVTYVENEVDNDLYSCTWQVPIIKEEFGGIELDISLLELIEKGARVFIIRYE